MADIRAVIAAVVPDRYSAIDPDQIKKIIHSNGIAKAIEKIENKSEGKPKIKPLSSYSLIYDSPQNQLEPVYYWILDFMENLPGVKVDKVADNFMASPGSGQFSEMGAKATAMQQQATKLLADTNTLVKTILNLVYDLKEFEMRLEQYKRANSKDKKEQEEGMLALKNIWLDQVDLKRGRGSIHQMSAEMGYTTLREAFLVANDVESLKKMAGPDGVINDSVLRVLIPRMGEFLIWKDMSEKELTKRFEIEKSYLKSEVENLKMYTKWARPYLKAAEELRMKGFENHAALVSAFSTSMFELTLMGTSKAKMQPVYEKAGYKLKRDYSAVLIVSLKYRGHLGQKAGQGGQSGYTYSFGGRFDITFDCYALNSEEMALVKKTMEDADIGDGITLVERNTGVALEQLKEDIDRFTGDKEKKKEEEKAKKEDDINPFSAIFNLSTFSFGGKKEDKKEIKSPKDIEKDNFVEKIVRKDAADKANTFLYLVYDIYKKAHAMASSPENFDNGKVEKSEKDMAGLFKETFLN
jgi:hypothetical protein